MVCITHPLTDMCCMHSGYCEHMCTWSCLHICPSSLGHIPIHESAGSHDNSFILFFFDNSFKLFFNIIYFSLCWVFIAVLRLSLVVGSRGYSLAEVLGLLLL